jgi:hypothetical protein
VRRAAIRRSGSSGQISQGIIFTDDLLRQNVAAAFSPELAALDDGEARDTGLAALDMTTSWEAWEHVRRHGTVPAAVARRVMMHALSALLPFPTTGPASGT